MRITAKRHDPETGVRRLWNGERGWSIKIDGEKIGEVGRARLLGPPFGYWYFAVGSSKYGVPRRNTASEGERFEEGEEARDAALKYVRSVATAEMPGRNACHGTKGEK